MGKQKMSPWAWIAIALVVGAVFGFVKLGSDAPNGYIGFSTVSTSNPSSTTSATSEASFGFPIGSLQTKLTEKYSGTVNPGGNITVYDAGVNPSDSTAKSIAQIVPGTAYTGANIVCGKTYSILYQNGATRYGEWLGANVVLVDCDKDANKQSGIAYVDVSDKFHFKPAKVATLVDILNENSTSVNGQSALVNWTSTNQEIQCSSNAGLGCEDASNLVYDESAGDGQVYLDLTFSASGSQSELQKPVLTFQNVAGSEPEGNEISSMTLQQQTGADLGIPSNIDLVNIWKNQDNIAFNSPMVSGTNAVVRLTISYDESLLDDNADKYKICFDDLGTKGSALGKDAINNYGATIDCVTMDSQA